MPKIKTRKSFLTRLKITKNGKILRRQSFRRHLKAGKSAKRLKNLKASKEITNYFAKRIRKSMGIKKK